MNYISLVIAFLAFAYTIYWNNIQPIPEITFDCINDYSTGFKVDKTRILIRNDGDLAADDFILMINDFDMSKLMYSYGNVSGGWRVNINRFDEKFCQLDTSRGRHIIFGDFKNGVYIDDNSTKLSLECKFLPPKSTIDLGFSNYIERFDISVWARNHKYKTQEIGCKTLNYEIPPGFTLDTTLSKVKYWLYKHGLIELRA